MAGIYRRKLLQLSGVGAVTARTGGIASILATSRAPAYAQGATVHWLRWNDFVPASDELLKKEIAPEAEKAAVQGVPAEDAVKWADAEFRSIHAA